jgi:hypothetical protein
MLSDVFYSVSETVTTGHAVIHTYIHTYNSIELSHSVWEPVKRGLEPGGRGIAIVGADTRKRLVTE